MRFVRPESLGLVNGHAPAENVIESQVVHSEFEGSFFSVFLRGDGAKDIVMSMTNSGNLPEFREGRSEEHTSELQSLMRISYAVFCLKKNKKTNIKYLNTTG